MNANAAKARQLQELIRDAGTSPGKPIIAHDAKHSPRVLAWFEAIDRLPPSFAAEGRRLIEATLKFASSEWAQRAIDAGWSDGALFALDVGLVPVKLRRGDRLTGITSDAAKLQDLRGQAIFDRPRTDAPPWFSDPRIVASESA